MTDISLVTGSIELGDATFSKTLPIGSGTGLYDPFLATHDSNANGQTNDGVAEGFNNDATGILDVDPSKTSSLKLSDMPITVIDGVEYYEIRVDLNETNNTAGRIVSLNSFKIYTSASPATLAAFNNTTDEFGAGFTKVYDLDDLNLDGTLEDRTLILRDDSTGSGTDDYSVLIKVSAFGDVDPSLTYLTLYTNMGRQPAPVEDGGFEEWKTEDVAASITGIKFEDLNGNTVQDAGEDGLGGVTIFLDRDQDGTLDAGERTTVTDADGSYTFFGVGRTEFGLDDVLWIDEEVPAGYTQTTGDHETLTWAGEIAYTVDPIGNQPPEPPPAVNLVKTANPTSINEGVASAVLYTYAVTNTSPAGAADPLTIVSLIDDNGTPGTGDDINILTAGTPVKTGGDQDALLEIGETWTYSYTRTGVVLNPGEELTNIALVTASDDEGNTATDDDTETVTGSNVAPTITVTKLVDANGDDVFNNSESIVEGVPTTVTYKVTIANTSNSQDPVTLTSILDDKIANDAGLLAAAIAANGGSATLAPGASVTFTYDSDAPLNLDDDASHVNVVTVSGTDDEGTSTGPVTDDATVQVSNATPTITVTKLVDANGDDVFNNSESIVEGVPTTVTYKVTIANTSNSQDPVTLTSILDDKIANDAGLLAAAIAANGGSATLAPGASVTFTYDSDAPLNLDDDASHVNVVTVSGTDDEGTSTGPVTDDATVQVSNATPTITVTKLVDANGDDVFNNSESIVEGVPTTVTYKVTIANTSNSQDPVTLTSILDDKIANDAGLLAAAIAANGGSATLAPGASVTFTYDSDAPLNLDDDASHVNVVTVSGTDDEGTSTGPVTDDATVQVSNATPTITVTKLVDANGDDVFNNSESIVEGVPTTVTYKVTIANTSNSQDPVTLTSILDDKIANDAGLLAAAIAANGGSATLAPGASVTFTYDSDAPLNLDDDASHVNVVTVSGTDDEGTSTGPVTDDATVQVSNATPTITVTKLVDANGDDVFNNSESIVEGVPTTVTYKVTIANTSNSQDPVTLTSILDDKIANDAGLLAAAIAANGGSATLAPGASVTFTYDSDAPLNLDDDASHVNVVTVSGTDDEGTSTGPVTDDATVQVSNATPTITVTKLVDANGDDVFNNSESIVEGVPTTVTYKVTIANTSNSQDPVTLTSILDDKIANDAGLLLAAIAANLGSATLAPGASLTFTYDSDAPLNLNADASHVNVVTVSGTDDEGTSTGPVTDDATVTASNVAPAINIEKTVDADGDSVFHDSEEVQAFGDSVVYKYEVTNTSPAGVFDPITLDDLTDDGGQFASFDLMLNGVKAADATLVKSGGDQDALLETGETWTFTKTVNVNLNPGEHLLNTAVVTGADDDGSPVTDSDTADILAAVVGPGVRTPGFWGNLGNQFWDGVSGNETKVGPNFPVGELTYLVDGDNNPGTAKVPGLLIGDYDKDGVRDPGEDVFFISLTDAHKVIDASQKDQQDGRFVLGRDAVATWLNYLAGNPIGGEADSNSPHHYLDEGIDWLQATNGGVAADAFGDWGGGAAVKQGNPTQGWNNPLPGVPDSGNTIHTQLDSYNNTGSTFEIVGGVKFFHMYASDGG